MLLKEQPAKYTLPDPGLYKAVCCDVIEGIVRQTQYGEKARIAILWELDKPDPANDEPLRVYKEFNTSFHSKSKLRGLLEAWLGRLFSEDERLTGFETESLVGLNCQLSIVHSSPSKEGKVYADVAAIMPVAEGTPLLEPSPNYVRVKDRPPKEGGNSNGSNEFYG